MGIMLPSSWFVRGFCRVHVGIVAIRSGFFVVHVYPCSIEILACTMPTIGSDGMFLRFLHKEKRDESTVTTGKSVLLLN